MEIGSITYAPLPCCNNGRDSKVQTNFSLYFRIAAIVLGVFLLITADLLATGTFGNCNIWLSNTLGALGLASILMGVFVRFVKEIKWSPS